MLLLHPEQPKPRPAACPICVLPCLLLAHPALFASCTTGATDAARAAADIVLTDPGLSVVIHAIIIARQIFQRVKNFINCERSSWQGGRQGLVKGVAWSATGPASCVASLNSCPAMGHCFSGPDSLPPPRPFSPTRRPYRGHPAAADLLLHCCVRL